MVSKIHAPQRGVFNTQETPHFSTGDVIWHSFHMPLSYPKGAICPGTLPLFVDIKPDLVYGYRTVLQLKREGGAMAKDSQPMVAISVAEHHEFGCPHCGYLQGFTATSPGESLVWRCGADSCGKTYFVFAEGIDRLTVVEGELSINLQPHPKRDRWLRIRAEIAAINSPPA